MTVVNEKERLYRLTDLKWVVVHAEIVQVGDEYANNGTVTAVVEYPEKVMRDGQHDPWLTPKKDRVTIQCGEGFAVQCARKHAIVVGLKVDRPQLGDEGRLL